jgi:CBS domain containing-hemolysin-like protein/mannitol/fructose-specific phosphotransferase system IIA component (Ntr-type)
MSLVPVALLLIALNGLFVLVEYAVVRVRASRIEVLARRGSARALSVQAILGSLDRYLAAIQVALTVISLALGSTAEPVLAERLRELFVRLGVPELRHGFLHGAAFGVGLVLLSFVQIVCAELIPRAIGIQKAETISLWAALPLQGFAKLVSLPVTVMSFCSTAVLRLFGMKPAAHAESVVSEEEMRVLLGETQEKGALPLERLLLLENLFDLGAAKVAEAMTPRDRVHFLSLSKTWEENLALIRAKKFSRYPLCEKDDLDTVVGFVHVKDLVMRPELGLAAPDLRAARRDLTEVAGADSLEKLLKTFPDKGINLALVRDASGRVAGILTLEDMIEELVGEVHDEFDRSHAWSLMDVLVPAAVTVGLQGEDRREAIVRLMDRLALAEPSLKAREALQVVWERELKFSSAVGRGVAVPHGRLPGLEKPMVAVGRFAKPVPFPSPDSVPVRLVFLILTPAQTPVIQLKVLGRIAAIVTNENLRRKLLRAKTNEALLELLRTGDTMLA